MLVDKIGNQATVTLGLPGVEDNQIARARPPAQHVLCMQQLLAGVAESGFVSVTVARRLALTRGEQREVSVVLLAPEQFGSQVKLSAEAIQGFYDTNKARFQIPEQIRAEYVTLSAEGIAAQEVLAAGEARKWYDDNMGVKFAERSTAKKTAGRVNEIR